MWGADGGGRNEAQPSDRGDAGLLPVRLELQEQAGRAVRLADVAAMGPEILQRDDVRGVNRWLRKHVRLYVAGNHVALVEWV